MTPGAGDRTGRTLGLVATLSGLAGLTLGAVIVLPTPWAEEPRPRYGVTVRAVTGGPVDGGAPTAAAVAPVTVSIPSIGLRTDLVALDIEAASGALVPPERFDLAGWYTGAPVPGEIGPAVITGHVDSARGPAVFYDLERVRVGARIAVSRSDGSQATFEVVRVTSYPKTEFPTAEVYGATSQRELRLITCGGTFDRSLRSYLDNVVVYAVLV